MAVSYVFRQTFCPHHTARWQRRLEVLLFGITLVASFAAGGLPLSSHRALFYVLPYVTLFTLLRSGPSRTRGVLVTSLDDRAMLKYGGVYDAIAPEQQKNILDHYRVGTYLFPRPDGEKFRHDETRRRFGHGYVRSAFRLLGLAALPLALVYWAGWHWLPAGWLRASWTNLPMIATISTATCIALPRLLQLWAEPES